MKFTVIKGVEVMNVTRAVLNQWTHDIIGVALDVHKELGPGLLESTYEACTEYVLLQQKYEVERQKSLPIVYKGLSLDQGYRIDLLVNRYIIIEIKAVEALTPIHEAQVLSYLKHSGCKVGLLLNFNVKLLREGGIRRFIRD